MKLKTSVRHGFTIVELLVVIVVIAILATITIVSYNGITERANRTQSISAIGGYAKALALHALDKGAYPISGSTCIGTSAICGNITGLPSTCFGIGRATGTGTTADTFKAAMLNYVGGSPPTPSPAGYSCGADSYGGAFYYSGNGTAAYIYAFFKSVSSCPAIGGVTAGAPSTIGGASYCLYTLPSPV